MSDTYAVRLDAGQIAVILDALALAGDDWLNSAMRHGRADSTDLHDKHLARSEEFFRVHQEFHEASEAAKSAPESDALRGLCQDLLAEVAQYADDVGPCDHAVNICRCDLRRLIDRATDLLAAKNAPGHGLGEEKPETAKEESDG